MATATSNGGAYVPNQNYDRTGATDINATFSQCVVKAVTPQTTTLAALTLTAALYDGAVLVVNRAAGSTITLPAATGSGAYYRLFIGTTLTSGSFVVAVGNANDFMRGQATTVGAAAGTFITANTGTTATESDTITFNRTTTGLGTIGDYIQITDIAVNVWFVELIYASSGTAASPFSAAV